MLRRLFRILALCAALSFADSPARAVTLPVGSGQFNPGQAVAGTTPAAPLVPARTSRFAVTIENSGTTAVWLGGPNVTITNGFLLPGVVGASVTMPVQGSVYGVVATGTATVSYIETF